MTIKRFREYSAIHPHLLRPGSGLKSEIFDLRVDIDTWGAQFDPFPYTPDDPSDWGAPPPDNVPDALDWLADQVAGGAAGGITQLTNDVETALGTGIQSATVKGLDTRPLDAAAPAVGDLLKWDGTKWTYQAVGDLATESATRVIHTPGITPTSATFVPGIAPDVELMGTLVVLHYKKDIDKVYGYCKIPTSYVSDASFHIHWTKNVNTNQSGATVRWVINYTVFNGGSQDVTAPPTGTLTLDDTYDDAGLLTRVVHRTGNAAAAGFVAGYYVSFEIGFDPAHTTLSDRPAIVSCDILSRQTINEGN
jgi:hypothetical protein